jgi:hypothetical protein
MLYMKAKKPLCVTWTNFPTYGNYHSLPVCIEKEYSTILHYKVNGPCLIFLLDDWDEGIGPRLSLHRLIISWRSSSLFLIGQQARFVNFASTFVTTNNNFVFILRHI